MTVTELIEKLKLAPPDLEVVVEGCDCIEAAIGISVDTLSLISEDKTEEKERVIVRQESGACSYGKKLEIL